MNSRQQHAINIFVRIQNLATLLRNGLGAGEAQRLLYGETAPWAGLERSSCPLPVGLVLGLSSLPHLPPYGHQFPPLSNLTSLHSHNLQHVPPLISALPLYPRKKKSNAAVIKDNELLISIGEHNRKHFI